MGSGTVYKCKKCGHEFNVLTGIGMLYPHVCNETKEKIRKGKYGKEWKTLLNENPDCIVNCERELLICEDCGTPKTEKNLSLYLPRKRAKTNPYAFGEELEKKHTLLAAYPHRCKKCGGSCKAVRQEIFPSSLKCPKCGEKMVNDPMLMISWD